MEMERGIELFEDGHLEQARAAFGSAIDKDRENAEAYARRGFMSLALDDTRGAMADLERALTLDPDLALAYNFRGVAYAMTGDGDRAILEFTRAVSLAPAMSEAYFNRAGVYLQSEDPKAALADLDTVAELDPENPSLYLVRAQVHLILGNTVEAEADLLQVPVPLRRRRRVGRRKTAARRHPLGPEMRSSVETAEAGLRGIGFRRVGWLLGMCAILVLALLPFSSYIAAMPFIQEEWGIGNSTAGVVFAAYLAGYAVVALLVLPLTDRLPLRRVFLCSAAVSVVGNALFPVAAHDPITGSV